MKKITLLSSALVILLATSCQDCKDCTVSSTITLKIDYFNLLPVYLDPLDSSQVRYDYFFASSETINSEHMGSLAVDGNSLPSDTTSLLLLGQGERDLSLFFTPVGISEYCGSDLSDVSNTTITTPVELLSDSALGKFSYNIIEVYDCK